MAEKYLRKVYLDADVFTMCLQHALTTEKEEIMGLLIGAFDEDNNISYISGYKILHRSDKQPDRVEISPEQLSTASTYAEELAEKLKRPMNIVGWYHSHPHITVWPSHVDYRIIALGIEANNFLWSYSYLALKHERIRGWLMNVFAYSANLYVRTQGTYQMMHPLFVGLIFSVYQSTSNSSENEIQVTCFQSIGSDMKAKRREIELIIKDSCFAHHNLEDIAQLPKILMQEDNEIAENNENKKEKEDLLANFHNNALKTIKLVHFISQLSKPMSEDLKDRLSATQLRIKELEQLRNHLKEELIKCN